MKYGILFLLIVTGCSNSEINKSENTNVDNSRTGNELAFNAPFGYIRDDLRKSVEDEIYKYFTKNYPNSKIKGFSYRAYKGFLIYWCDLENEKLKIVIIQKFFSREDKLYFKVLEVGDSEIVDLLTKDVASKAFNKVK